MRLGVVGLVAVIGCGADFVAERGDPPGVAADAATGFIDPGPRHPPGPNDHDLVTPMVTVPAGAERQFCWYIDNPFGELAIRGIDGYQHAGGHHIAVMIPDTQKPSGTFEDCTSGEATAGMRWFVAQSQPLPVGIATEVPADMRFVIQFHYVNATDAPITVADTVRFHGVDPATVTTWATTMIASDVTFALPPGATTESYTCTLDRDRDMLQLDGHMHEYGTRYALEAGPSVDQLATLQTVDPWLASYRDTPPMQSYYAAPIHLAAGTVVRTTCSWLNPTAQTIVYPSEMCFTFMYLAGGKDTVRCAP